MATATQIATQSLKRLGIVQAGETAAAIDVVDATAALNRMLAGFIADGYQGDFSPLDDPRFEQALIDILALRIAPEYNVSPSEIIVRDAARGEAQLDAAYLGVPKSVFDAALVNVRHNSAWIGITAVNPWYKSWVANTDVELRETRAKDGNLYECTTAGLTGSTGPSGTGDSITDGTATWIWRRAVG